MSRKNWKLMLAGVVIACAFGAIGMRLASATPARGVTATVISGPVLLDETDVTGKTKDHQVRIKTKGLSDVYFVEYIIPPGGHTGWHSHPGPCIVTVRSGEATEYHSDDPNTPRVYPAGTGFAESAGEAHLVTNEGETDLELVVLHLNSADAPRRIDEPQH